MAQQVRACAALAKDWSSTPAPTLDGSELSITPTLGDPRPLANVDTYLHMHIPAHRHT